MRAVRKTLAAMIIAKRQRPGRYGPKFAAANFDLSPQGRGEVTHKSFAPRREFHGETSSKTRLFL